MQDTVAMNASLLTDVPRRTAPRFASLQDIRDLLSRMAADAGTALAAASVADARELESARRWLTQRGEVLENAMASLHQDAEAEALTREWLLHAPAPDAAFESPQCSGTALRRQIGELESYLTRLFELLMQHSGSDWSRDLYLDLLDHSRGAEAGLQQIPP